jgi:hypothetical protein
MVSAQQTVQCLLWCLDTKSAVGVQQFRQQYLFQLIKSCGMWRSNHSKLAVSKGKSAEIPNTASGRVQCKTQVFFSGSCKVPDDHHHYLGWAIASNVNFTFAGMLLDTYSSYKITPPAQSVSYVLTTTLCSFTGLMVLHKQWSSERSVVLQSQF